MEVAATTTATNPRHTGAAPSFAPQSPMTMSSPRSFSVASAKAAPSPSTPSSAFSPTPLLSFPRKPPRRQRRNSLSLASRSAAGGGGSSSSGGAVPHRARAGRSGAPPSLRRYRTRARERRCAILATAHVSSDAAAAASVVRATLCPVDLEDDDEEEGPPEGGLGGDGGSRSPASFQKSSYLGR